LSEHGAPHADAEVAFYDPITIFYAILIHLYVTTWPASLPPSTAYRRLPTHAI